jgi:hypothetical protein
LKPLCGFSFVQTIRGSFVQQIELAKDAMRMEELVKLFSMVFGQISALKVVNRFVVSSLTHELTSAEVTMVFHRRNKRSGGASGT